MHLDARRLGEKSSEVCSLCGSKKGRKLTEDSLYELAHRFFVWGSLHKVDYGAAPVIQFNQHQKTSITVSESLEQDIKIFEKILGVGFFYYGPRLWMTGEIYPLNDLQDITKQEAIIERVFQEYPTRSLDMSTKLYRIRNEPLAPKKANEYDSPPIEFSGHGRLDEEDFSILYASEDLSVCLHECRVTAAEDIYVATLYPTDKIKMLDLTVLIKEKGVTEFESLDLAIHFLFLAGSHSYSISRKIAREAKKRGYDGIIYPSYFSLLHHGIMPFQTTYGLSHRLMPQYQEFEQHAAVPNAAIFGHPIAEGKLKINCINRLVLTKVSYDVRFGPVL